MALKKPPSAFEVHFEGKQLFPEKIPLRVLLEALSAIQRLVTGSDDVSEEGSDEMDEDDSLRLLEVQRGSAVYKVVGPSPSHTKKSLRVLGRVLQAPDGVDAEHDYMLSPIERLSAIARRLDCTISLREPGKKKEPGTILAKIEPHSYENISKYLLIKGDTSFSGEVVRVGGATAVRCGLRVPFQNRMLICKVSDSNVARQIGKHLYQDVVVHGTAEWLRSSWRIFRFTIKRVHEQPVQGSLVEAMEALREAGGKAWDHIADPAAYLEGIEGNQ